MNSSLSSRVLAHRGHWKNEFGFKELGKNSVQAINRAADLGFGIEIDIRDSCGEAVISHDPALNNTVKFTEIIGLPITGLVALNVKADGLVPLILSDMGTTPPVFDYFFFDMSFPESLRYRSHGLPVAERKSEFEQILNHNDKYVWVDSFNSDWYLDEIMLHHKPEGVKIIVVSPELHNRPVLKAWEWLAKRMLSDESLHICTDYPLQFLDLLESS